ncbi:MAG: sulfatase family protein [Janthinobacterium lividum]
MPPITRRVLLSSAATVVLANPVGAQTKKPNIVFILADDMGSADLSCYGRPDLVTPNIDRLAATGIRFNQAYANSPVCTASRVAIITGRYQLRLPVGLEEPISRTTAKAVGLPPDQPTLPSLLRKAGYGTTLIGKWHLGNLPEFGPLQSGYDHFYGFRSGGLDYYTHVGTNGAPDLWDDDAHIDPAGYTTDLFGNHALEVIAAYAQQAKPFLLSLHFNAPHWPWEARGDQAESERLRGKNLHDFDGGTQDTYRKMITAMDEQVGRVMAALEQHGLARDTIVVFTSDNGGERYADTWPFTGRKTELLEGGLRIPALISWPARLKPAVSEQVTANMDWLPTLLAAAGTSPDPAYPPDGLDLMPHLDGAPPQPRSLFWRYKALWQRAVRIGDLKYLKIVDNTFLFDVAADPMERANLKDRRPLDYARLTDAWTEWNAQMLPETEGSFTENFTGAELADHIALHPVSAAPDPTLPSSQFPLGTTLSPFRAPP